MVHPLRSTLQGKTTKTFVVDSSLTVAELANTIAHKLQLPNPADYSLKLSPEDDADRTTIIIA